MPLIWVPPALPSRALRGLHVNFLCLRLSKLPPCELSQMGETGETHHGCVGAMNSFRPLARGLLQTPAQTGHVSPSSGWHHGRTISFDLPQDRFVTSSQQILSLWIVLLWCPLATNERH